LRSARSKQLSKTGSQTITANAAHAIFINRQTQMLFENALQIIYTGILHHGSDGRQPQMIN